ncbi:MAG: aminotransferase class I/II-fold pyridoxal phosphate-dependent enzyme, partial [Acidimicrobiaceae bacterium]|nr:aminotransferase class I/II-fold pyridoxal phosphate-dependent enzyme [Acidimicrobiaceae bacterium]
ILNQKLGIFLFCRPDRLEVLHGASQVLPILAHIFEGMTVSIPSPTFGEYSSRFPNARQYSDHHHSGINIHELQNVTRECDVVVIVNPNSPTGSTLPTTLIVDLAENNPQTTFIVDESFLAFTDENSIVEVLEDKRLDNILVIASLSKTLGIPGLRLGYIYSSNARLLGDVRTQIPVWNLSSITEYFLELVIKFRADLSDSILMTKQDRGEFANALGKIVAIDHVHAGGGNFIMACLSDNFPMTAAEIRGELLNLEKIEVKDVTTKFSDGKSRLRIAVRSHGDNIRLVQALTSLVERRSQRDIGA